jgi:hypothetical protein
LRIVALLGAGPLHGKGAERKAARENAAHRYLDDWFDADVLRSFAPRHLSSYTGKKDYNHFDPDFIYRYAKLSPTIPSIDLVGALAAMSHAAESQLSTLITSPRDVAGGLPA